MNFKKFRVLLVVALLAFSAACDEESTGPVDADVQSPTNLRAASADEAIILDWTPSTSESQDNFGGYKVTVLNKETNATFFENAAKGTGHTILNLDNGTRYKITVAAVTSLDKESVSPPSIEWAPAVRRDVNQDGQAIRVYTTTSTSFNSAVDLFNESGICEVIPQAGAEFKARGDFFVYAPDANSNFVEIRSPSAANNQGMETQFSTVSYNSDDLDDQYVTTPPATGTYAAPNVTVTYAVVSAGKVVYGRLKRGGDYYYFRLLIKRDATSKLIQGSGNDRFLEFDVSFQHIRNVPFAKH